MRGATTSDNAQVCRLRQLSGDVLLAVVVVVGVIAAAALDWTQGQAPASRIAPVEGFVPFLLGAVVCMAAAILATDTGRSPSWRFVSLVAALFAAAIADPTYAALLVVVPLVDVARRSPAPQRTIIALVTGGVVFALAVSEASSAQGANFESILVLAIVLGLAVMFGGALRRSDQARLLEARLARLDERDRLAQDIHDSLGHNLLASSIQLRSAGALIAENPDAAADSIELASRAVAEALSDVRLMVDDTRSGERSTFSLEQALPGLVERASTQELSVSLDMQGDHDALEPGIRMTVYRFAQEALANVLRHADATLATVVSTVADQGVTVAVADDGLGFDTATTPERTGLGSLRERVARHGGSVTIESTGDDGTTVTARIGVNGER
ncbi:MAG: sensor histidine kinase [Actinomycetota bacterium]